MGFTVKFELMIYYAVYINVYDYKDPSKDPIEIGLDPEDIPMKEEDKNGNVTMDLGELIPMACGINSPFKGEQNFMLTLCPSDFFFLARGGHLYRPGVQSIGHRALLGRLDTFDTKTKAAKGLNKVRLREIQMLYNDEKDILSCNLFQEV